MESAGRKSERWVPRGIPLAVPCRKIRGVERGRVVAWWFKADGLDQTGPAFKEYFGRQQGEPNLQGVCTERLL